MILGPPEKERMLDVPEFNCRPSLLFRWTGLVAIRHRLYHSRLCPSWTAGDGRSDTPIREDIACAQLIFGPPARTVKTISTPTALTLTTSPTGRGDSSPRLTIRTR